MNQASSPQTHSTISSSLRRHSRPPVFWCLILHSVSAFYFLLSIPSICTFFVHCFVSQGLGLANAGLRFLILLLQPFEFYDYKHAFTWLYFVLKEVLVILFNINLFYFLCCECVYLSVSMCIIRVQEPSEIRRSIQCPETGVTYGQGLPCGYREETLVLCNRASLVPVPSF